MDTSALSSLGLALAFGGSFGGLMAGMLGVGGGIIFVPILFAILNVLDYPLALTMHISVASSLCIIIMTSISSVRAHHRKGAVDLEIVRGWAPWVVAGAIVGGLLARVLDASVLTGVFGVVALLAAANLMLPKTYDLKRPAPTKGPGAALIASSISFISTLMGIGGGSISVPTLTAFGVPVHRAVGTSSAIGFFIALPGAIAFMISGLGLEARPPFSLGYVNFVAVVLVAPLSVLFAPLGAKLAHAMDPIWLKRAFGLFLAFNGVRMLLATFSAL